jgi:hypothetical protein
MNRPSFKAMSMFWSRHRGILLVAGCCTWVLGITALNQRTQAGPRTTKGAAELLDIGALPVT